jgi:hypothetical protein
MYAAIKHCRESSADEVGESDSEAVIDDGCRQRDRRLAAHGAVACVVLLSGCSSRGGYEPVQPAVVDERPENVYVLINTFDTDAFLIGKPVIDLGDGNIAIDQWTPRVGDYRSPMRTYDGFPRTFGVADRVAFLADEKHRPPPIVFDSWWPPGGANRYRVGPVRIGELPHSFAEIDGPHVAGELIARTCANPVLHNDFCNDRNEEVCAVIVEWPDTSDAPAPTPGSTAHRAR